VTILSTTYFTFFSKLNIFLSKISAVIEAFAAEMLKFTQAKPVFFINSLFLLIFGGTKRREVLEYNTYLSGRGIGK